MKKTLLLSVVASTMIMAGGDIAPVEPVVVAEVEASAWEFSGNAVAYTQTTDLQGTGDLFGGDSTSGLLGLQLRAVNKDLFAGIGAGVEVSAIANGDNNGYSNTNFGLQNGSGFTQAYLTYGMDSINTSLKVGRQHLPKSLSPFAYTEGWQALKNSFDAALIVNTSISNTVLVGAFVNKSNGSTGDIGNFGHITAGTPFSADDGIYMIAAQNKSIENLTLTGNYYFAPDMTSNIGGVPLVGGGDVNAVWGDATYKSEMFTLGLQAGSIMPDGTNLEDTTAFGVKVAANLGMFDLLAAYSTVDDGSVAIHNWGTGVKTPLYTQSIANQNTIKLDSDAFKIAAGMKALGGKFGLAYINADLGNAAIPSTFGGGNAGAGNYDEIDATYKTKIGENTTLFAAYVYQDDDRDVDTQNFVRFWARYNF